MFLAIRFEAKLCKLGITEFGMHLFFYEEWVILFLQIKDPKPMTNRSQGGKWGWETPTEKEGKIEKDKIEKDEWKSERGNSSIEEG